MGVSIKRSETSQADFAETLAGVNYIPDSNFSLGKLRAPYLAAAYGTLSIQTSGGYSGDNCLKFTAAAADSYTVPYDGKQAIVAAASPDETWTFSVYAKGASGGESIELYIFPINSSWAPISHASVSKTATTTWTRYSVSMTMPANTIGIAVRVDVNGNGSTAYFDAWQLEKGSTASAYKRATISELDIALSPGDIILSYDLFDSFEGDSLLRVYTTTGGAWERMTTIAKTGTKSLRGKGQYWVDGGHSWDARTFGNSFSPPIYAEVYLYYPVATGYFNMGIAFGVQGTQSFYKLRYACADKAFLLEKLVNGTDTYIAGATTDAALTGWLRMCLWWGTSGSITGKLYDSSGTLKGTVTATDTTFTSGYVGQVVAQGYYDHADARFDDFLVRSAASGTREIAEINLSPVGTVKSSSISWSATTLSQTCKIETRVSTDGGSTYTSWSTCTSGNAISGLSDGTDVSNGRLQCRQTLSTTDRGTSPALHSLDISVIARPHGKSVSVDASALRSISGSAYSAKSLTLDTSRLMSLSGLARSEKALALESARSGLLFNVKKVRSVSMESAFIRGLTAHFLRYAQAHIASSVSDRRIQIAVAVQTYLESLCPYWEAFPTEYFYRYLQLQLRCDISKIISGLWSREEHEPSVWSKEQVGASVWTKRPAPVSGQWTKVGTSSSSWVKHPKPADGEFIKKRG